MGRGPGPSRSTVASGSRNASLHCASDSGLALKCSQPDHGSEDNKAKHSAEVSFHNVFLFRNKLRDEHSLTLGLIIVAIKVASSRDKKVSQ